MNGRIFIKDWLKLKPYQSQVSTDLYYLRISNEVKKAFLKNNGFGLFEEISNEELLNLVSCFLTSYFEDIISESGIWKSFTSLHNKMYGKILPFYPTTGYVNQEINQQDVSFLIWYVINKIQEENVVAFNSESIAEASKSVMEIFDKEFEYALENEKLKSYYEVDNADFDYYEARHFIDTILFKTYLFYPDTSLKLQSSETEIFKTKNKEHTLAFLNDNRDNLLHKAHTSLLGLKGAEWAIAILGNDHLLSHDLKNMSRRIVGYFLYKGQDDTEIFLEHIASGKKFKMTMKSFAMKLIEIDSILYLGLVNWHNEWWFSGVNYTLSYDAELVAAEKKSFQIRHQVEFLDYDIKRAEELLADQMESFLKFNNGSLISFMHSSRLTDFSNKFIKYYNDSLNISAKGIEESNKRADENNIYDSLYLKDSPVSGVDTQGLVFFNPKSGLEMAWGINNAFPLPDNPNFDEEESVESILTLLTSPDLSKELLLYAIEHCRQDLRFFQIDTGKDLIEDIDFLMRFYKMENYFTKPAISLINNEKVY